MRAVLDGAATVVGLTGAVVGTGTVVGAAIVVGLTGDVVGCCCCCCS